MFFGMKHGVPLLRRSGRTCSIINMSSIAGMVGVPQVFAFAAVKGAVRSMSRSAAAHCADSGYPSERPSFRAASTRPITVATARQFAEAGHVATPAGQTRDGQPADVAHMIVFLARDEPKHINGAEIVIKNSVTARQGIAP